MEQIKSTHLELQVNEVLGRHLIAKHNIPSGCIILEEPPLAVGPKMYSSPVCLGCNKAVNGEIFCDKCGYPMCSLQCDLKHLHEKNECTIFQKKGSAPKKISDYNKLQALYQSILPLRCLLLKLHSPRKWQVLNTLEHHTEMRKQSSAIWNEQQVNIVQYLLKWHELDKFFSEEMVNRVIGIIEVNCFQIKTINNSEMCGIFPTASMIAHDCIPNMHNAFTENGTMILRSSIKISKGEVVTIAYVDPLLGTIERRQYLKLGKYFDCTCRRCQDPIENGTFLSGIKCQHCETGYLSPQNPLEENSRWICFDSLDKNPHQDCNYSISSKLAETTTNDAKLNLENLESSEDPIFLHNSLDKYKNVLHPNHYLLLPIRRLIIGLESKSIEKQESIPKLEEHESKILEFLDVLDKTEPGLTRTRGILLHYLLKVGHHKLKLGPPDHNDVHRYHEVNRLSNLVKELEKLFELDKLIGVKTKGIKSST